jgi:hypothetical protein
VDIGTLRYRTVRLLEEVQRAHERPSRIEGCAIVSADGMIATAKGAMPCVLKFDADQEFFEQALNGVDVVVHGRHSRERHRRSDARRRLVLTRRISSIASHPNNRNALFWNPAGVTLEQVLTILGQHSCHRPSS